MRKELFVIVFILVTTLFGEVRGQDIDISRPLTLNECIGIGLERSPTIRMAGLDLRTARLSVLDARADYWPRIDASGQYRFSDMIDFGWERQNYDAQLTAGYTIWDHGRRKAGLAQAKANERSVQNDYDRTEQSLIFNITEACYTLLEAEKLIDVNEKLLEISKGNVEKATAFQEAGRAIPSDVATARVQQANDELALINAQNNFDLARARLASLMGLDPGILVSVMDEDVDRTSALSEWGDRDYTVDTSSLNREVSLEESVATAIQNRPELGRLKVRLISLEWSLMLARLDRWPVITAEYGFNVFLDDYLRDRDNFKKYRNWSAVARVSFPIFDSGSSRRRERSAEIAVEQVKEDISDRERSIKLEVKQAYLDMERARKSLDIAIEQVKNATESLNATQGRYDQNMVIFLQILDAQARYAQALNNRVRAFYDLKIAQKALEKAMGTLKLES